MCLLLVRTLLPISQQRRYFYMFIPGSNTSMLSPLLFHHDSNKQESLANAT